VWPNKFQAWKTTKVKSLNKTIKSAVLGLLVLVAFSVSGAALEQNSTEDATVDVTVESDVAVDVHPTNLVFTDGTVGSQDTASDDGYSTVDMLNTGSEYVDQIWVNTSTPGSDPFGSGSAASYDAGNFFQVKPNNASSLLNGDDSVFHYVNRIEYPYNLSQDDRVPSYLSYKSGYGADDNGVYVGRFRAADQDYLFVIYSGSPGVSRCDAGSGNSPFMRVADTPQTDSQVGTTDFSDSGTDYTRYNMTSTVGNAFGLVDQVPTGQSGVTLDLSTKQGSVTREYEVLTNCGNDGTTPRVIRTRYNVEAAGSTDLATSGSRTQFLLTGSNAGSQLEPGASVSFDTAVEIPRGVAAGSVTTGDITFVISADSSTDTT